MRAHLSRTVLALALLGAAVAAAEPDPFLADEDIERLRAVNEGELVFLPDMPPALVTRSELHIAPHSLDDGWVRMTQCQAGLDAVEAVEIHYDYAALRDLQIRGHEGVREARVEGQTVQLRGVRAGARVCVGAEVRILQRLEDGRYAIRSGPYHRRFLDGYFPMELRLLIRYPAARLAWTGLEPPPQGGLEAAALPGAVDIRARFVGRLTLELLFEEAGE